jgi:hypothetical protein
MVMDFLMHSVTKHFKYLNYVIRHKYFVFIAGRKTGVTLWRLLIHDLSKFSRAEWTPYVNRFFSGRAGVVGKELDPDEFHKAWTHHWHNNPHHWEYWLRIRSAEPELHGTELVPMVMPSKFVKEMVADWMGAGRAITGEWGHKKWYAKNQCRMILHPNTRELIESIMSV